jgi:hypothetical protein
MRDARSPFRGWGAMKRLAKSTRATAAVASVATLGAVGGVVLPSTPAFATGCESGNIPYYGNDYASCVDGSGAHITGMAATWAPYGLPHNYAFAVYSKASNGEPVGNALGDSPVWDMSVGQSQADTYVAMNVNGASGQPYCAFIYQKTSGAPILLNGGPGVPACITLG